MNKLNNALLYGKLTVVPLFPPVKEQQFSGLFLLWSFPGGSDGKELACNAGDMGSIPGLGRSPGNIIPLQCSCLENLPGLRSLAGHSPWGHKELDMTE